MPEPYRSPGERLAYIDAEIERLKSKHWEPCKKEILDACVKALDERKEMILAGNC